MPRNGSGTYTAPSNSFNPATTNTVIDPNDWNDTLTDLASALTDSLSRTGEGGMQATLDMGTHAITNLTSVNKVTITAPATSATLTIPDGVVLTGPAASGTAMTLGNPETVTGIKTFSAAPVLNALPTGTAVATANTVSTLVARDGSGNFSAGTITAALTGNASTATTATNATNSAITNDTATNATMNIAWVTSNTGNLPLKVTSTKLTFNPSTGALSATSFSGSGSGLTSVPLSGLATQAAFTFVGNNTSGSAAPTAVDIAALTAKASPAASDLVIISDQAASGAWKKATVSSIASAGSVASIGGATGVITLGNAQSMAGNVLSVAMTTASNVLGADVNLSNTALFFDGPSMAQGTSGTWFVSGTVTLLDASAASYLVKLWDGTTVIASTSLVVAAGFTNSCTLSGILASPAANIRISVRDVSTTAGKITFNTSGLSKDSNIWGIRII